MYINGYFTGLIDFPGDQLPYVGLYDWNLVVLSIVIAICGAWAGLSCLTRANSIHSASALVSAMWKVTGAVAFGGSIWGMHFVGMLAFSLPCGISYDILLTSISIAPGILASLTAMTVVGRTDFSLATRLCVGSVLMGAGIGAMHYTGMAAMRLPAILMYDPLFAMISVCAAIVLSFIALYVVEHGQREPNHFFVRKLIAAGILGSAVASMHYVAMQAAIFYPTIEQPPRGEYLSQTLLALLIGLGVLALTGTVVAASFAARLKETARVLAAEVRSRTLAEKTARADQMRLQAIFDTAVEAIIVIDRWGRIQQWSRSAEIIFGYTADDVCGENVNVILDGTSPVQHNAFASYFENTDDAAMNGIGREVDGRRRDGTVVPIELSVGRAIVDGEILYTGILRDITIRKAIEQELLEATKAKQANELKSNFLAHMSHEMRTPLNAILGFSDVMKQETFGPLDKTYKDYANDIFSSGNHLLNVVNALLDLSKVENAAQDLNITEIDLRVLLNDVTGMLRGQAEDKNLTVSTLIDSDLQDAIQSDRGKLLQIIINLVNNAVKYTPDDGRVSLRARPDGDMVEIIVEDTGIGMSEEEVALAVKPFGQVKNAFTSNTGGTGLGLPIVVSFVDLLGGDMTIDSIKNKGTTVIIRVPADYATNTNNCSVANAG